VVFLRRLTLACAGLLTAFASAYGAHTAVAATQHASAISWLSGQVYAYEHATWRWQQLMGIRRTPTAGRVLAEMSVRDVQKAVAVWKRRARRAHRAAAHPPHLRQFLCIHRYEASWTESGAPYYGGLQMDLGFQQAYAPALLQRKGTADHWTPLEQIWTAEKAARSRGFWPWPNTARACGLL
jgi:hypothetical protein